MSGKKFVQEKGIEAPNEVKEESKDKKIKGAFKISFNDLNEDFKIPSEFRLLKKLGTGAYGKVMEVEHLATG